MSLNLGFRGSLAPLKVIIASVYSVYIMERRDPTMAPKVTSWIDTYMMRQSFAKTIAMTMGWEAAKEFLESGIVPGGGNA